MFQPTDTSGDTPRAIGPATSSLPDWLTALGPSEDQIRDTGWAGYPGEGYWPREISLPDLGPDEVLTGDLASYEPDPVARVWRGVQGKRALTPEEIAARQPPPATIGKVEFITLAQLAGGMTDDMLVEAHANPLFAAFWIKFQMASVVDRDNAITKDSLTALAQAGYLPNGEAAVLAAWPTA